MTGFTESVWQYHGQILIHGLLFQVLPVVVFFSTAISVLYYLGWMQVIIQKVSIVMQLCMGTTAGESLNAAGNIFIGQVCPGHSINVSFDLSSCISILIVYLFFVDRSSSDDPTSSASYDAVRDPCCHDRGICHNSWGCSSCFYTFRGNYH